MLVYQRVSYFNQPTLIQKLLQVSTQRPSKPLCRIWCLMFMASIDPWLGWDPRPSQLWMFVPSMEPKIRYFHVFPVTPRKSQVFNVFACVCIASRMFLRKIYVPAMSEWLVVDEWADVRRGTKHGALSDELNWHVQAFCANLLNWLQSRYAMIWVVWEWVYPPSSHVKSFS